MTPDAAPELLVSEVFSAIQGEAALVGHRQVFLRLTGCNIRCAYCDQPEALERRPGPCRAERTAGRRDWARSTSPLAVGQVTELVTRLWDQLPHHSVSVTGGEPLVQSGRLAGLLPALHGAGMPVMLETNGTSVSGLRRVLPWLTYVSMDVKLASVDGEHVDAGTQQRFLRTAIDAGVTTWVKVVIGPGTDEAELDAAAAMVASVAEGSGARPEVYLQPVTPFAAVTAAPSPEEVLRLHEQVLRRYPHARVVPQTHKMMDQL